MNDIHSPKFGGLRPHSFQVMGQVAPTAPRLPRPRTIFFYKLFVLSHLPIYAPSWSGRELFEHPSYIPLWTIHSVAKESAELWRLIRRALCVIELRVKPNGEGGTVSPFK